ASAARTWYPKERRSPLSSGNEANGAASKPGKDRWVTCRARHAERAVSDALAVIGRDVSDRSTAANLTASGAAISRIVWGRAETLLVHEDNRRVAQGGLPSALDRSGWNISRVRLRPRSHRASSRWDNPASPVAVRRPSHRTTHAMAHMPRRRDWNQRFPLGLNTSSSPSPRRLNPSTVRTIARPGNVVIHQASRM